MEKLIAIFKVVMALFPLVVEMVKTVEAALPMGGAGAQKLEIVRKAIEDAFTQMQDLSVTFGQVWPVLQNMIAGLVALYNAKGVFQKQS